VVQVAAIRQDDLGHRALVAVDIPYLDRDGLIERELAGELFSPRSERLLCFGTVDPPQPDPLGDAIVDDADGVAICDANKLAGEVLGKEGGGLTAPSSGQHVAMEHHMRIVRETRDGPYDDWRSKSPQQVVVLHAPAPGQ
jgi:hypothetical protein